MNLIINTRSVLEIIDLDTVDYLKADGNYTYFYFQNGKVKTELSTLAVFDNQIEQLYANAGMQSPFYRMGRSFLVNINHVSGVNTLNLAVTFRDEKVSPVSCTRGVLKSLRDHILDTMCPLPMTLD